MSVRAAKSINTSEKCRAAPVKTPVIPLYSSEVSNCDKEEMLAASILM